MPDLLGPDPCSTCGRDCGIPPYRERNTCPEWRAYAANVKLLEKIRGMGTHGMWSEQESGLVWTRHSSKQRPQGGRAWGHLMGEVTGMSAEDTKPCRDCDRILKCGPGWPITPDCCSEYGHWEAAYAAGQADMAREIVTLRSDYDTLSVLEFKGKYGFKEVHNFEKTLFAWLRMKGVM
jgi:hypothetical protein